MVLPAIGIGMMVAGSALNAYGEKKGRDAGKRVTLAEMARQRDFDLRISQEIDKLTSAPLMDPGLMAEVAGAGTAPAATAGVAGGGGRGRAAVRAGRRNGRRAGVLAALAAHDIAGREAISDAMIENLLAKDSMRAFESEQENSAKVGSKERTWGNTLGYFGQMMAGAG